MELDYEKLGLKCGLEIHQQLDTNKLFCNCSSILRQDSPDFIVKRKLHAVAGELGEVDVAAKHEMQKDKTFVYEVYDTTCLVELDEEPPYEINKEALKIALQIAIFLKCEIVSLAQIMRKTVIDGSNTSGFQRTVFIARDGYVETSSGKVGIEGIFLEEDSARFVNKNEKESVYKLDRLGIPLVEIATAPDIKTPEQAKEVALHIGNILRSCKVKRGIGTIRQDVNISIKGSNRVELKGFQDPKIMIKAVENEIKRQHSLKKGNPSEVRNVLPDGTSKFLRPMPGHSRMYPETDLPLLKISRDLINEAKKTLPKLKHETEKELEKFGLGPEMIKLLFKQNKFEEFKEFSKILNNPKLIAKILLIFPRDLASHEKVSMKKIEKILNKDILVFVLENLKNKKISEEQVKEVLKRIVKGEEFEKAIVFEREDINIVEEKIVKIIKEKPGLSEKAYMGLVMSEFKGKVSGKELIENIKKHI